MSPRAKTGLGLICIYVYISVIHRPILLRLHLKSFLE